MRRVIPGSTRRRKKKKKQREGDNLNHHVSTYKLLGHLSLFLYLLPLSPFFFFFFFLILEVLCTTSLCVYEKQSTTANEKRTVCVKLVVSLIQRGAFGEDSFLFFFPLSLFFSHADVYGRSFSHPTTTRVHAPEPCRRRRSTGSDAASLYDVLDLWRDAAEATPQS